MTISNTRKRRANREAAKAAGYTTLSAGAVTVCISREVVANGKRVTEVRFEPSADMPGHEVRLVGLDPSSPIASILTKGYAAVACKQRTILSRSSIWSTIKSGFLSFLLDAGDAEPSVDEQLIARFVNWLNRYDDGEPAYSLRTRRNYFKKAMNVLQAGADNGNGLTDVNIDWRLDPWAGQNEGLPPERAFLSSKNMTAILRGARTEIETTFTQIADDLDDLVNRRFGNPVAAEAERLRSLVAETSVDMVLPVLAEMASNDAVGAAAVRLLTPRLNDLMPFIVTMAHYTGFNASTIVAMVEADIKHRHIGNARWTIVESYKRRSKSVQRAVFAVDDAPTNPARLLRFVLDWTGSLRRWARSERVWLACVGNEVRDLGDQRLPPMLASAMQNWLPRNKLPPANFSSIRKGILDLAHLASGGDEAAVRAIGGQRSPDVIAKHYTSPAARNRDRERLALAVQELERLVGSNGKVDARRLPDMSDRSAATPGFSCADRYSSPIVGEKPGRACQAYGHCPICPLALVDRTSPRSCGYLHLLLDRVVSGLTGRGAALTIQYIGVWVPVAERLRTRWLPLFDKNTRTAAKQLELPPLPEIE